MTIQFIKRQVDSRQFIKPAVAHWGNIGKGKMATSQKTGNAYPTETPHFNFTFNAGYEDLGGYVTHLYGAEPMSLDMIVLKMRNSYDPEKETLVDLFAPSSMQEWAKSKYGDKRTLMTECDSHSVLRVFNPTTKKHDYNPKVACGFNPDKGECAKGCKATMRFSVILPDLCREVGAMGYFTLTVHGRDDIRDVTSKFLQMGMRTESVVWRFSRNPKPMQFEENGKVKESIQYPVSVEALIRLGGGVDALINQLLGAMTNAPQIADVNNRAVLPSGGDVFLLGSDIPDDMGYTGVAYKDAYSREAEDWTPADEKAMGNLIMQYLHEFHENAHTDAQDIFIEFGHITTWEEFFKVIKPQMKGKPFDVKTIIYIIAERMGYVPRQQPTPQPAPQPTSAPSTLATVLSITGATESQILEVLGFRTWDDLKKGFGQLYPAYWLRDENGAYLPMSQDLLAQAISQAYKDSL